MLFPLGLRQLARWRELVERYGQPPVWQFGAPPPFSRGGMRVRSSIPGMKQILASISVLRVARSQTLCKFHVKRMDLKHWENSATRRILYAGYLLIRPGVEV